MQADTYEKAVEDSEGEIEVLTSMNSDQEDQLRN